MTKFMTVKVSVSGKAHSGHSSSTAKRSTVLSNYTILRASLGTFLLCFLRLFMLRPVLILMAVADGHRLSMDLGMFGEAKAERGSIHG